MKKRGILLACFLAMVPPLLTGCGGGKEATETVATTEAVATAEAGKRETGRGDLIEEEPSDNGADFTGCWEYRDINLWMYFYGDGTYETFDETDVLDGGSYHIEDGKLYLSNSDNYFEIDENGEMTDRDGDILISSQVPEGVTLGYDAGNTYTPTVEDFYGSWENESGTMWVTFKDDGTIETYLYDGSSTSEGYTYDDGLITGDSSGRIYYMDADINVIDDDGTRYTYSEIPQYVYDNEASLQYAEFEEQLAASGSYVEDDPTPTPAAAPAPASTPASAPAPTITAADFYGVWEDDGTEWLCINADGTYNIYWSDGLYSEGTYYMDGTTLRATGKESYYNINSNGYVVDEWGTVMVPSTVPQHLLEHDWNDVQYEDDYYYDDEISEID